MARSIGHQANDTLHILSTSFFKAIAGRKPLLETGLHMSPHQKNETDFLSFKNIRKILGVDDDLIYKGENFRLQSCCILAGKKDKSGKIRNLES